MIPKRFRNNAKMKLLDVIFIVFCLAPFIIPNPVVTTNIQPYAALFGIFVIFFEVVLRDNSRLMNGKTFFAIGWLTLFVALIVLLFSGLNVSAFRALFNYFSVAIVPMAAYLILNRYEEYPEKIIKVMILVWFFVASVQFFISRKFLTGIIGGVRFSESYRGVVGLASEPSFLGIACFYFMHMAARFKKHKTLFFILLLIMGIVYAQSLMGVMFMGLFLLAWLLEAVNSQRGLAVWLGLVAAVVIFILLLNTVLADSRLAELIETFMQEGVDGVMDDASAGARYGSFVDALADSFGNYLLPLGYKRRIGSGYGGFLCELGFFALPVLWCISRTMAHTFQKKASRVLYFILVTFLLFNNTQIGNPMLLFVLASNLFFDSHPQTMDTPQG